MSPVKYELDFYKQFTGVACAYVMFTNSCTDRSAGGEVLGDTGVLKEVSFAGTGVALVAYWLKVLVILRRYINHLRVKKSSSSAEVKTIF
jgi:hypothetical protein